MRNTFVSMTAALLLAACGGSEATPAPSGGASPRAATGAPTPGTGVTPSAPAAPAAPSSGQVCAGERFTCVLQPSGHVLCTGKNLDGTLGDATTQDRNSLVPVVGLADAVDLDCGARHACAVRAGGQIVCWGRGTSGELGNGEATAAASTPVPVAGIADAVEVALGYDFSCARRRSGAVSCWGEGESGALGNGATSDSLAPVAVSGVADAVEVDAGRAHACVRRASGEVMCWGNNGSKQLGQGATGPSSSPAPLAVAGVAGATALGLGWNHSCAATAAGLFCWGLNEGGQMGNGTNGRDTDLASATLVPSTAGATAIAAGQSRTCALFGAGEMRCWGYNNYVAHLLGITVEGDPRTIDTPTAVPGATDLRALASGAGNHSCGIRASGALFCVGEGGAGERGDGNARGGAPTELAGVLTLAPAPSTVHTFPPTEGVEVNVTPMMALGQSYACGIDGTGQVFCFGEGSQGQLGMGSTASVPGSSGRRVPGISDAVQIAAYSSTTCVSRANGLVACWGSPGNERNLFEATSAPVPIAGLEDVAEVAVASGTICARLRSGAVSCLGSNNAGQLGNGNREPSSTPVAVPGLTDATRLVAATDSFCVLRAGGTVSCWGSAYYGELGQGDRETHPSPVEVPRLSRVTALDGGGYDFCAITGGAVKCWGYNDKGQIGNGEADREARALSPTDARGVRNATAIGVGHQNACAVNRAGEAFCWGANTFGQTGHGETTPEQVTTAWQVARDRDPTVAAFSPYAAMDCGVNYCCGLHRDGHFSCAGSTPLGGSSGFFGLSSTRSAFPVTTDVSWPATP